ncbi:MAG: hypothetical protein IK117_10070 [Bacteroidales bacterium]|nr:hypothetical protein [Bacteroidales bacterium]
MAIYNILTTENNKEWVRLVSKPESTNCKKASSKKTFDYYIKESFINGEPYLPKCYLEKNNSNQFGFYLSRFKRYYDNYFFKDIPMNLSEGIQNSYTDGKGNEFKTGKYYSVASSSRFATASFAEYSDTQKCIVPINEIRIGDQKHKCDVVFEKSLGISTNKGEIISSPQIDVYIETDKDIYFIEVKCHEIFDNHTIIKLKSKYKETDFIQSYFNSSIKEKGKYLVVNGEHLVAQDFGCKLTTTHFDFKQFLCHLMGILSYDNRQKKNLHFYYLFYKNELFIEKEGNKIYTELETEIQTIFNKFRKKHPNIDFGYFYNDSFNTIEKIENQYNKAELI